MYFWKDKELALKLRKGGVSEKEKLYYFLGGVTMHSIEIIASSYFTTSASVKYANYNAFHHALILCISLIGLIICYRTNMKGDRINFIERIVSLSFTVDIRVILYGSIIMMFSIVMIVVYGVINNFKIEDLTNMMQYIALIISALITVYYYYRINNALKIAASTN